MFQIKDNFLPEDEFLKIKNTLLTNTFPWYYVNNVAYPKDNATGNFYLSHTVYEDQKILSQPALNLLGPILLKLEIKKLFRVKCNFYPHTPKIKKHALHCDHDDPKCNSALFYINSNNGYTGLSNNKIKSIENRMLFFNAGRRHRSTNCTDTEYRININFNYMKKEW